MQLLEDQENIDLFSAADPDPRLTTASLFGEARGKMFGVLECLGRKGNLVLLRAFSGQFNGIWEVPGWAPPLFDGKAFATLTCDVDKEIKRLGRAMSRMSCNEEGRGELRRQRRRLSQGLMQEIHGLYRLHNFRGRQTTLFSAYCGLNGIPTGTGDCCAPKLLNEAARQNLIPTGIAEFYWGRGNRSDSRQHGCFYPSCQEKCAPILGFLLCGLEDVHAAFCN